MEHSEIKKENVIRIIVTAGPTQEPIDPVRFISNRSTGLFGYLIAKEALKRNYENRKQKNVGEIKKVETISSPDIPVDMDKGSRKIESALMVWGTCKVKEGNQKLLLATSLGAVAVAISVNLESFTVQEYGATDMRAGSDGTTYWGVASIILTGNKDNPFVEISLIGGK